MFISISIVSPWPFPALGCNLHSAEEVAEHAQGVWILPSCVCVCVSRTVIMVLRMLLMTMVAVSVVAQISTSIMHSCTLNVTIAP